jgi:acyl carrier protein
MVMTQQEKMEHSLIVLFGRELQIEPSSPETDLLESGLLDSLKLVELLAQVEIAFGIQVSADDLETENFRSISKIATFLQARGAIVTAASPARGSHT